MQFSRLLFNEALIPGTEAELWQAGSRNETTRKYNDDVDYYDFFNLSVFFQIGTLKMRKTALD